MSDKKLLAKAVMFGTVCGLLAAVILTCIFTVVLMTCGLLPAELTNYVTVCLLSLGTLFGGFITSKITKSAGLIAGLLTGTAIFLLVTATGMLKSNESITMLTLIRLGATLIAGGAGGILGLRKKKEYI